MSNKIKLYCIIFSMIIILSSCKSTDKSNIEQYNDNQPATYYNTMDIPSKIETFDNSIKISKQKIIKHTIDEPINTNYWDEDFLNDIEIIYIDGYDDYIDDNYLDDTKEPVIKETNNIKTYSKSKEDEPDTYNYSWKTDGEYWYFEPSGWKIDNTTWYTLCNCVANEAGSYGITDYNKALVCEVIFNRLWDWGYNSVYDVVAAYNQFEGSENYISLIDSYYYKVNDNVINAVAFYCSYPEIFNEGYHFFYGDGYQNHFRY